MEHHTGLPSPLLVVLADLRGNGDRGCHAGGSRNPRHERRAQNRHQSEQDAGLDQRAGGIPPRARFPHRTGGR